LKPNTFTYNAVINALAKSGEPGAAARAERVLQNMVNRHRNGGSDDVKPTTINFNTVLDAWAKSGGGRQAAERAEEILEWMDRLHKGGNPDVKPDTITFNAVLDSWARSGERMAPHRAEQILDHMDELYRSGNSGVKPDTYTYNTLINAWAKCSERGSAARAEHVLCVMENRYNDGDKDFKPNTRTYTSVIDALAKSGEKGAAIRCEQRLNIMIERYEATGDSDAKPNVHTANAVCNVSLLALLSIFRNDLCIQNRVSSMLLFCFFRVSRPAPLPRLMKIVPKRCKLPFVYSTGFRPRRICIRMPIRIPFCYPSVPTCCHGKIRLHDMLMQAHFLEAVARQDMSMTTSCASFVKLSQKRNTWVSSSIVLMIQLRECPPAGRAMQAPTRAESPSTRAGKILTTITIMPIITTTIIRTTTGEAGRNDARENDNTLVNSFPYGSPTHHKKTNLTQRQGQKFFCLLFIGPNKHNKTHVAFKMHETPILLKQLELENQFINNHMKILIITMVGRTVVVVEFPNIFGREP
jgi:Pentatricopeptide repeat domain/PPR repeat